MHMRRGRRVGLAHVALGEPKGRAKGPPLSRTDGRFSGTAAAAASALLKRKGRSYLVDPASSHMLVSKIKPCMCKYKLFCTVRLRMAH